MKVVLEETVPVVIVAMSNIILYRTTCGGVRWKNLPLLITLV
ncbi:hypothetical protein ACFLX1_01685 [Chloroflexota bacterium]